MKKLTYSFLLLMLLTSVPALADYAPVNVQTALKMANTQTRFQLLFTLDGGLEDERNATYFNNLLGAEVFLNT